MNKSIMTILNCKVIISILFLLLCIITYKYFLLMNVNEIHYNKMLEGDFLRVIVNSSGKTEHQLKQKWKNIVNEKNRTYILFSDNLLSEPFFLTKNYKAKVTDFYGYIFQYNEQGNLIKHGLYKP